MVRPACVGAPLGGKLAACGPRVGLVLWEPGSGGVVVSPFMAGPKLGREPRRVPGREKLGREGQGSLPLGRCTCE